jgi:Transglutaminase-like superfamily
MSAHFENMVAESPRYFAPSISRRKFIRSLHGTLCLGGVGMLTSFATHGSGAEMNRGYLAPTRLIDSDSQSIAALAAELCVGTSTDQERAVRIHNAVRDRIQFGIAPYFYDANASQVLKSGVGFCNTKSTLFCALLRAQKIPARLRFIELNASVLRGLFSPGTATVDHSIAEVFISGAWHSVDSYVVDQQLEKAARQKLQQDGLSVGYGIHAAGSSDWDGASSTFIQAVPNSIAPGHIVSDLGYFDDVQDFYKRASNPKNRLNVATSLFIRLGASGINKDIQKIRSLASA